MAGATEPGEREAAAESRWEAAPAILLVIGMQVVLTVVSRQQDWSLWRLPWWIWLLLVVPEAVLLTALAWSWPRRQLVELGQHGTAAFALFAVVSVGNGLALVALIASLLAGDETNGAELLHKGLTIWITNVIAFGLWFWALDGGGPTARREPRRPLSDWQFPQHENPGLAEPGWHPRLFDYVYVAFTNAIAFSPTDALPLTHRAKLLMLLESASSALTVLLVAARAVNILR